MKKYLTIIKQYWIPIIIILALALWYHKKRKSFCGPCKEKGMIIKKGKAPYSQELHRNALRAKQAAAAFKSTGFMPKIS